MSSHRTYLPLVSQAGPAGASLGQQLLTWELACQVGECPPLPAELAEAYGVYEPSPRLRRSGHSTQLSSRTISYQYDLLYRLTGATYSTGESYQYVYDPVGNRLEQIISGDTTTYLYDAANRLQSINGVSVNYDANGNLLTTGVMTNTWDSANRLIATLKQTATLVNHYDGLGNRIGRTQGGVRVDYVLDVAIGLPEVVYTSEGHKYLHLPGLIMTESDTGEVRYLLSDGLGSVRHVTDEAGVVVAYREYSPYGEPVGDTEMGYGFTGEWFERDIGLLHLRARWYDPGMGTFLSRDAVESEPPYQYVRGNVVNRVDPSGFQSPEERDPLWLSDEGLCEISECQIEILSVSIGGGPLWTIGHIVIVVYEANGDVKAIDAGPANGEVNWSTESFQSNSQDIGSPGQFINPNQPPSVAGQIIMRDPVEDQMDPRIPGIFQLRDALLSGGYAIVARGKVACDKWRCLKDSFEDIHKLEIPYNLLGPNSNSVAFSALKACGLPTLRPIINLTTSRPWRNHPGWGIDLFSPMYPWDGPRPYPAPTPPLVTPVPLK